MKKSLSYFLLMALGAMFCVSCQDNKTLMIEYLNHLKVLRYLSSFWDIQGYDMLPTGQ